MDRPYITLNFLLEKRFFAFNGHNFYPQLLLCNALQAIIGDLKMAHGVSHHLVWETGRVYEWKIA